MKKREHDCPRCGKPLKNSGNGKYFCENDDCSVIFVRRPDMQSLMQITYKASSR